MAVGRVYRELDGALTGCVLYCNFWSFGCEAVGCDCCWTPERLSWATGILVRVIARARYPTHPAPRHQVDWSRHASEALITRPFPKLRLFCLYSLSHMQAAGKSSLTRLPEPSEYPASACSERTNSNAGVIISHRQTRVASALSCCPMAWYV